MCRRLVICAPLVAVALMLVGPPAAAPAATTWLCLPGKRPNPCAGGLSTTLYSASLKPVGTRHPKRDRRPPVDCFYVYPTVSDQRTVNAVPRIDPEISSIARFQAARYSQHCRVFAPVYRQVTLAAIGLGPAVPGDRANSREVAYKSVLAAWREYLRKYNHGRGFVLIGHSQGTGLLTALIAREIDRKPARRRQLVAAFLLGGGVTVKRGSDRGGSFRTVGACRAVAQLGCVVAFNAFNRTPPPNARFGRAGSGFNTAFGGPASDKLETLCVNPAALRGGAAFARAIAPSRPFPLSTTIGLGITALGLKLPQPRTTYVEARRSYRVRCSSAGGARTLQVRAAKGAPVPNALPDAGWGLHLLDGQIVQGNLVELLARAGRAYARRTARRR